MSVTGIETTKENPIFTITEPDGKVFHIFANGMVEGFADGSMIFNGIPNAIYEAQSAQYPEVVSVEGEWNRVTLS